MSDDQTSVMTRRRRLLFAFILGALTTLVFAPFHLFPFGAIGFTGLLCLLWRCKTTAQAGWTGWFFGWGHFIAGLYWIASAFLVEPEKFAWMIPFPVLGLPALLAVFPALAVMLTWRLTQSAPTRVLALAATWTLLEMARGTVLTGFPWNLTGYAWGAHQMAMQAASWVGIYGMSFLAVLLFGAPFLLLPRHRHVRWAAALILLPILVVLAAAPRVLEQDPEEAITVRVVQGNIQQRDKWRPDLVEANFWRLMKMSAARGPEPDVIIWPETAATYLLSRTPEKLSALATLAGSTRTGLVITGAPRLSIEDGVPSTFNSALAIRSNGEIAAIADKHHLVPFGEYLPLRSVLQALGLEKLAQGRGDFSAGAPQQTLKVEGLPAAAVLICYEVIFPSVANRDERPGWLLNLTNDGWFGELTGPDQHFAMARFRAVEQGLPLIRAAGTGISAVVSRTGVVLYSLDLGAQGILDARVAIGGRETLFSQVGSLPVLAAMLLLMVAIILMSGRKIFRKLDQNS